MTFQYQYKLVGFLKEYSSFIELLRDVPLGVAVTSIIFALGPFLVMVALRSQALHSSIAHYRRMKMEREMEEMIRSTYNRIARREKREIFPYIALIIVAVLFYLAATRMIFFSLVIGDSMLFTLQPFDLALTHRLYTKIEPGDIVVFQPEGELNPVIHRVTRVRDGVIRTKGDNLPEEDGWPLTQEDIMGKVVTFRGRPIVLKDMGIYFYPIRSPLYSQDPMINLTRDFIFTAREYGLTVIAIIMMIILLDTLSPRKLPDLEI